MSISHFCPLTQDGMDPKASKSFWESSKMITGVITSVVPRWWIRYSLFASFWPANAPAALVSGLTSESTFSLVFFFSECLHSLVFYLNYSQSHFRVLKVVLKVFGSKTEATETTNGLETHEVGLQERNLGSVSWVLYRHCYVIFIPLHLYFNY